MVNIYPIGTIIKLKKHDLIILGYAQRVVDDKFVNCYIVAPYPIGFTSVKHTRLISVETVEEVVFEGYKEDEIYKEFIKRKQELFDSTENISAKEVERALDLIAQEIEKQKGVKQ